MKEKELLLKALCNGLPYGLKIKTNENKWPTPTVSGYANELVYWNYHGISGSIKLVNTKPILRPLSDLTKEIEHNGQKTTPLVRLFDTLRPYDVYESFSNGSTFNQLWFYDNAGSVLFWIEYNTNEFSFDVINRKGDRLLQVFQLTAFEILNEWHFDIYRLIEKGLAIDVNTLEENPYK